MSSTITVSDAGLLIAFARLNALPLLIQTLGSIAIPQSVADECVKDVSRAGANAIRTVIANKTLSVHADPMIAHADQLIFTLGSGESAAIILALQLQVSLLIDDKCARIAAKQLNIYRSYLKVWSFLLKGINAIWDERYILFEFKGDWIKRSFPLKNPPVLYHPLHDAKPASWSGMGIKVIGSAGVLLLAKKKGLISAVMPVVQQLQRVGYYLSKDLIGEVAKMSGENSPL